MWHFWRCKPLFLSLLPMSCQTWLHIPTTDYLLLPGNTHTSDFTLWKDPRSNVTKVPYDVFSHTLPVRKQQLNLLEVKLALFRKTETLACILLSSLCSAAYFSVQADLLLFFGYTFYVLLLSQLLFSITPLFILRSYTAGLGLLYSSFTCIMTFQFLILP